MMKLVMVCSSISLLKSRSWLIYVYQIPPPVPYHMIPSNWNVSDDKACKQQI